MDLEIVEDVDVEAERAKSKSCPFWPDKEYFYAQFNFKDLPESDAERIKSLLWDFKHCFYNEQFPQQFAAGLKMRPVKIDRLPDSQPKREKLRRVSDKKLAYLKSHINKLLSENVIKELQDTTKGHASPCHVVIEQRYIASKNAMVEKSRLTIDLREINKILPSASWPLPHMDDFRQKCAEKGFKIFSNFDCSTFYHQIMVDPQCAAENFNFHALGRVYTLLRLAMGCKNSHCSSD